LCIRIRQDRLSNASQAQGQERMPSLLIIAFSSIAVFKNF